MAFGTVLFSLFTALLGAAAGLWQGVGAAEAVVLYTLLGFLGLMTVFSAHILSDLD